MCKNREGGNRSKLEWSKSAGTSKASRVVDMVAKLEELLMSSKLKVVWDLSTPAADIVAKL